MCVTWATEDEAQVEREMLCTQSLTTLAAALKGERNPYKALGLGLGPQPLRDRSTMEPLKYDANVLARVEYHCDVLVLTAPSPAACHRYKPPTDDGKGKAKKKVRVLRVHSARGGGQLWARC